MRKAITLLAALAFASVAYGQTFHGLTMRGVHVDTSTAAPPPPTTGLVFSPPTGTYTGTQTETISGISTPGSIFYTTNGYAATPASTLYSSPLSIPATTTINAIIYSAGPIRQNVSGSSAGWKSVVDASNPKPFSITGNCPNLGTGGGVAGVITDCEFDPTAFSGTALHLSLTSATSGTSQRQVLWTMGGQPCDDCTEWTQGFEIQPAENPGNVWAYENDSQLWDASRRLELTTGLQCYAGDWNVSGQSGWTKSGVTASCPPPAGVWTHVETHGHRVIGNQACTYSDHTTQAITSTGQTTFTISSLITPGMVMTIGAEQMLVTAYNASTGVVTVTRGYNGTTPATYISNTAITAPIECIYYDWISVNGVKTTLNKTFPAHPLPQGWAGGCYSQTQLDTNKAGTVGVYVRNKNMTCGYGTSSTGAATLTIH